MIPRLLDIVDLFEEMVPASYAEDWDNPGLQVGNISLQIEGVCLSLDPTLKAVKGTSKHGAQLLLTHHPLIFKPLFHLHVDTYPGDVVCEALKYGIAILSLHTNLDVCRGGINDILSKIFGLKNVRVLEEKSGDGMEGIGLGRIGDLSKPLSLSSVLKEVKSTLGLNHVRFAGSRKQVIRRMAVVGGSGGSLIGRAKVKGADLLVTGDISHHEALEAENLGLALIDGGHFETENAAFTRFADRLKSIFLDKGWEIQITTLEDEKNPLHDD